VATDNLQAGKLCAEAMIKDFPEGGLIAVLNYPANSACLDREKGFLETIEGKGFEVAATFDAEGTVEKGQNITSDILQAHPDIVAIFSINDQAGMGAYAACTTSGANVSIYGVDGAPEAKQVIAKEGSIYRMTAAQSPIKIGTNCYDVAMTILSGEKPAQFQIDVPAFTIDSTNIQDYLGAGWQ
jgi:ribose transport system substrate-binding protein